MWKIRSLMFLVENWRIYALILCTFLWVCKCYMFKKDSTYENTNEIMKSIYFNREWKEISEINTTSKVTLFAVKGDQTNTPATSSIVNLMKVIYKPKPWLIKMLPPNENGYRNLQPFQRIYFQSNFRQIIQMYF